MIFEICEYLATILDAIALVYIPDRLFNRKFKHNIIYMLIGVIGGVAVMEIFKNNAVIQGVLFIIYYLFSYYNYQLVNQFMLMVED